MAAAASVCAQLSQARAAGWGILDDAVLKKLGLRSVITVDEWLAVIMERGDLETTD